MRWLVVALPMVLAVPNRASADPTIYHTIQGAGTASCGTWTASRRAGGDPALQVQQWVSGFLSGEGMAASGTDTLDGVDPDGLYAWVDNWCATHPIEQIITAAIAFYRFHPHR